MLQQFVSFGAFEFDPASRELRKSGRPIKLDPQAARLLALLLEAPGQLASYDQIRDRLWGGTMVDHGNGIRRCLAQIRAALNDNAKTPIYIQTERDRGLRFIAPVRVCPGVNPKALLESHQQSEGTLPTASSQATLVPPWVRRYLLAGTMLAVFGVLAVAVVASAYGLAILAFCLGAGLVILGYLGSEDTPYTRAIVAIYMIAAMSYIANASTLPEVLATVVNVTTLPPALSYVFVMGLRFVPLYVLVLGFWVFLGANGNVGFLEHPDLEKAYLLLGMLFLLATIVSLAIASGDDRAWNAGLQNRWTLATGYAVVFAVNVAVWYAGRRCFRRQKISSYRSLFCCCAVAYLPLALAAFVTDNEHNRINRYDLDVRWPEAYIAANPDAIKDFDDPSRGNARRAKVGPDLRNLLNDVEFRDALRNGTFYKQHWDEAFQVLSRAVMFGYRRKSPSAHGRQPFVLVRFPRELADALRFQPVGYEK